MKKLIIFTLYFVFIFGCSKPVRRLASPKSVLNGVALSAGEREKLFYLVRTYQTRQSGIAVLEKIFKGKLNFYKKLKERNLRVPKTIDNLPTEGNLLRLLEDNPAFVKLLKQYLSDVQKNKKKFIDDFVNDFKKIDHKFDITGQASRLDPNQPHLMLSPDGKPSTRHVQLYANHPIIMDDGTIIEGKDLFNGKREFIRSLEGDILANVYDFDLIGLADEFVEKAKTGSKVKIGIDKQTYENKEGVRKVVARLRRGGVKVILVETEGINHQKIIVGGIGKPGKGKVIFSSGNFTASCIHPAGDFGESGLDHEMSYPNANHYVEIHDDQLVVLVKHELTKTLDLKLPVKSYPLAGQYRLVGETINGFGQTSMAVAFTPNGGLSDIMSNILAPEIVSREGEFYMATFAYPNGDSHNAVFERAKKEMESNGKFEVLTIGDSFFSTRDWAAPLEMIGHQVEYVEDTGIKLYTPNFENRWLEALGRDEMRRMMGNIYAAPAVYGRHQVEIEGETYEVEAKLHHKLKVLDHNTAVIGNSANFSKSAVQKNHEQFLMIEHPRLAEMARGIVRGLVDQSETTLFKLISGRNRFYKNLDDNIRRILKEITELIHSNMEEIEKIDRLAGQLENMVGFEQARKVILQANRDLYVPKQGSHQISFSFDLDDNVIKLGTEIITYNKNTDEEKAVSTHSWRRVKNQLGKSGLWQDFELREDSFRNFKDEDKIVEDLRWAMDNKPDRWKGPVFDRFVEALSTEASAANTTIITARGSRKGVYRALEVLKEKGYIKHLPPKKHIWCMSDPKIATHFKDAFGRKITEGTATNISQNKAMVMESVLDIVNKKRLGGETLDLTNASGFATEKLLIWTYSDDDIDNFNAAIKVLQNGIDEERWPNVKIGLYYTGPIVEGMEFRQIILQKNASPRRFTIREELEWIQAKFGGQSRNSGNCKFLMKDLLGRMYFFPGHIYAMTL